MDSPDAKVTSDHDSKRVASLFSKRGNEPAFKHPNDAYCDHAMLNLFRLKDLKYRWSPTVSIASQSYIAPGDDVYTIVVLADKVSMTSTVSISSTVNGSVVDAVESPVLPSAESAAKWLASVVGRHTHLVHSLLLRKLIA